MIQVDIVTPTRKLVEGAQAALLTVPSYRGEIQILPGHAELLTLLGTGVLVLQQDGRERRFAISYGVAEVRQDKVLVLAETAEEAKDINKERAISAQKRAEDTLAAGVETEETFKKHQLKLQRAIIRQHIAE
jgi:F-type H+-transporting ATPase subunit epsilon